MSFSLSLFFFQPEAIQLPSGRKFTYDYDSLGGLRRIELGSLETNAHTFSAQPGFGATRLYQRLPGFPEPYVTYWNSEGQILELRPPGNQGLKLFKYSAKGTLREIISGSERTRFDGGEEEGEWPLRIEHESLESDFSVKLTELHDTQAIAQDQEEGEEGQRMRPAGMMAKKTGTKIVLKERRINFSAKTGFAAAKFLFEFGSTAADTKVSGGRIGAAQLPEFFAHYSWGLSGKHVRKNLGQFFIQMHNLNETSISDSVATFIRSDNSEKLLINGRWVYKASLLRDSCDQDKLSDVRMHTRRETGEYQKTLKYRYDQDGQLDKVLEDSVKESRFKYDSEGNLVSMSSPLQADKGSLNYDAWGRLVSINEVLLDYDDLGRILSFPGRKGHQRRFVYTAGSDVVSSVQVSMQGLEVRVTYFYDHLSRLVGRKDTLGNSTQFFYALPDQPYLPSHIYLPGTGQLTTLVYDDLGRLMFVDVSGRGCFYVVCDRAGSPLLFVEHSHSGVRIAREISRGAWGMVTYDSDPSLGAAVPIGFRGGIGDETAGVVHMQVRIVLDDVMV